MLCSSASRLSALATSWILLNYSALFFEINVVSYSAACDDYPNWETMLLYFALCLALSPGDVPHPLSLSPPSVHFSLLCEAAIPQSATLAPSLSSPLSLSLRRQWICKLRRTPLTDGLGLSLSILQRGPIEFCNFSLNNHGTSHLIYWFTPRFTVPADTVSHFGFRGKWGKDEEGRKGVKYRLVLIHCVERKEE